METTPVGVVRIKDGCFSWDTAANAGQDTAGKEAQQQQKEQPTAATAAATANPLADGKAAQAAPADGKPHTDASSAASSEGNASADVAAAVTTAAPDAKPASDTRMTLTDINLEARPGTLTMIVGGVGCGKSSLLSSLIGHISRLSGSVEVGGRIAYVAQSAWIMNATLQVARRGGGSGGGRGGGRGGAQSGGHGLLDMGVVSLQALPVYFVSKSAAVSAAVSTAEGGVWDMDQLTRPRCAPRACRRTC